MCLAIPMQLVQRTESGGIVELDGIRRAISLALLPEAELGDHLLVHAGYAIARVDAAEAQETLDLLRQIAAAADEPPAPPA